MKSPEYSIGTCVKLHTNDDWNDLYGIIDDFVRDTIAVYCISMPSSRYYVDISEAGNILELVR